VHPGKRRAEVRRRAAEIRQIRHPDVGRPTQRPHKKRPRAQDGVRRSDLFQARELGPEVRLEIRAVRLHENLLRRRRDNK
jgi:hypothetical protein